MIGVHLDLKYQMPGKQYLHRWLGELAGLGIDTLLLEYEDKFPFKQYPFLRAPDAFTDDELKAFLARGRSEGLRLIPLVQSISHLEFALAHPQLADLREMPHITTQINLADARAVRFVCDLHDEVLAWHEEDQFVHLGADEVWHVGRNPAYADQVGRQGVEGIWADHMRPLIQRIIDRGKRPMVWDDILWSDPGRISALNLPKQTVMVSWNYGTTQLLKEDGTERLDRVRSYVQAGYDVVAAPCLNWGVLTPVHDHCLQNTQAWAEKSRRVKMLGMLNTAWACFHVPLPMQQFHAAATAAMMNGVTVDSSWQQRFFRDWFGVDADDVPAALGESSGLWEVPVGLSRGVTPIVYGYMDMVLHYRDADERRARGVYPLDWADVDFAEVYRRKIALLREKASGAVRSKLDALTPAFDRAAATMASLAARATRHREEAALYCLFADMKSVHARIIRLLVLDEGDRVELRAKLASLRPRLRRILPCFLEGPSVERMLMIWQEPAEKALAAAGDAAIKPAC